MRRTIVATAAAIAIVQNAVAIDIIVAGVAECVVVHVFLQGI